MQQQLSQPDLKALHSAPYGAHASGTGLHGLNFERARAQSKGCEFDGALYLLAKPAAYDNLRALQSANAEKRLAARLSACRAGDVQFLAATHFDGISVVSSVNRCSFFRTAFSCILVHCAAFNKISLHSILLHS